MIEFWIRLGRILHDPACRDIRNESFEDESATVLLQYCNLSDELIESEITEIVSKLFALASGGLSVLYSQSESKEAAVATLFSSLRSIIENDQELRKSFTKSEAVDLVKVLIDDQALALNLLDVIVGLYLIICSLEKTIEGFQPLVLIYQDAQLEG